MPLGPDEIEHRFGFHKATVEGDNATLPRHRDTRLAFKVFAKQLDDLLPDTREKALVFTALQEASMWTHCAIAMEAPTVDEGGTSFVGPALTATGMLAAPTPVPDREPLPSDLPDVGALEEEAGIPPADQTPVPDLDPDDDVDREVN